MDTADLVASGENLTVEFKRHLNDRELVRAVTCLANGQGGVVLLGVEDSGKVVGAQPRHGDATYPDRLAAYIQNNTVPALGVEVRLDVVAGREVVRVDVPVADPAPVATKEGLYVKRVLDAKGEPACVPMSPHEVVSMGMITRGQDYATAPAVGASMNDLDPSEFERYRRLCTGNDDSIAQLADEDILKALGFAPLGHPVSLGAVLLFGTQEALRRWLPTTEFLFQDLRPGELGINDQFVEPLLAAAERLWNEVDRRNSVTELLVGMHRVDIPLIPALTRRESIANALVHRDYSMLGPTTVQITENEFTVSNPGGFPPGVTIANILEESRPRSAALAGAFKRAGLVERRGKGVNDMFDQQLRAGRDTPDYSRSTSGSVTVAVTLGTADLDLVRFLRTYESERQRSLSLDELRVVHEVKSSGSVTASELAATLGMLPATVRAVAARLVEAGILEERGVGRSRRYHLTAGFYDAAQDRGAYVRVKGIDPLQQERMILDYVTAFESITRSQAAALCQTTPSQARTILKALVDSGRLRLVGERRGARYVQP
ncbi:MAG: putative DNA binding domain-containing protein [Dermatophilus congolensis]|nr:putative DNA binding domain-containing protein [Dermatophilus congolensis]